MKKFFKIGLSVLLIMMSVLIPNYKSEKVSAEPKLPPKVMTQAEIKTAALDSYDGANISSGGQSYYSISYSGNGGVINLGDITAPRQLNYTPDISISLGQRKVCCLI